MSLASTQLIVTSLVIVQLQLICYLKLIKRNEHLESLYCNIAFICCFIVQCNV